ncbi:MAG: T9SS type A sorting domain-containing protein, partial [Bacteroidetes bacterium]|nr:T9SS type A sorting domain-containing protein [Bacteroidota bacterium]
VTNYFYLCSEMNTLTGQTNFCNTKVGLNQTSATQEIFELYPNPFHSTIQIKNIKTNQAYQLLNHLGQQIYEGKDISNQDFSSLPKGIYFLRLANDFSVSKKIIKE